MSIDVTDWGHSKVTTVHTFSFCFFQNVEQLSSTYDNIVGDVLLAASCVAYLGPFILDYRQVRGVAFTHAFAGTFWGFNEK